MNQVNIPHNLYIKLHNYAQKHNYSEEWINYNMANILKHFWQYQKEEKIVIQILMLDGSDVRDLLDFCPNITNFNDADVFNAVFNVYNNAQNDFNHNLNLTTNFWYHYLNHTSEYQMIIQQLLTNFNQKYNDYVLEILRIYIRYDQTEKLLEYKPAAIVLLCDFIRRLSLFHQLNLDNQTSFNECFFELDHAFFNQLTDQNDSIQQLKLVAFHQQLNSRLYCHQGDAYLKPHKTRIIKFQKCSN